MAIKTGVGKMLNAAIVPHGEHICLPFVTIDKLIFGRESSQEVEQGQAYHVYVLTATSDALDCRAKRSMRFNDLYIEGADQEWDIERVYEQALDRQRQLAENLARISPIFIFDRMMSVLAGTDVGTMQRFLVAVRSYRTQVIDYLRAQTDR